MSMIDDVADYFQVKVNAGEYYGFNDKTVVSVDVLGRDDVAISFGHVPSRLPTIYNDGSYEVEQSIVVKVKHLSQLAVINAINKIFEEIPKLSFMKVQDRPFEFTSMIPYTTPSLVNFDANNAYTYSFMFRVSYIK